MHFHVYMDLGGNYRWRLSSGAREVAGSGKHFFDRADATRAAREFKQVAALCQYHLWKTGQHWYWDATGTGQQTLATGGERFPNEYEAALAAGDVRDGAAQAEGP